VATDGDDAQHDFVDALMASWAESRPDLDVAPVAVATRLSRVRDHLEGEMAAVFGSYGLTAPAFVMLATLARMRGSASEDAIAAELGLPVPTVGVRLDRLVADGLAERDDGGSVELTPRGRELADEVVPAHLSNQARLLAALTPDEQALLADLLRKLLVALEP
jgi:DNA-binding MarR family transcriptional regulator